MQKFRCFIFIILIALAYPVIVAAQVVPAVIITEFLPNPDGADADLEWVELFSSGLADQPLAGWQLLQAGKVIFDFGTEIIPAEGYLLVNLAGSKLGNCSNQPCDLDITLVNATGDAMDEVHYAETEPGKSWSKTAAGDWTMDFAPSPGSENLAPPPILTTLFISEAYASPQSGEEEWVELFNFGSEAIDLAGWKLSDLSGSSGLVGSVPAGGFALLADLSISLNNTGDTLTLLAPNGEIVDTFGYGTVPKGSSAARLHGVTGGIVITNQVTPGGVNIANVVVPPQAKASPPKSKAPAPAATSTPPPQLITYALPRRTPFPAFYSEEQIIRLEMRPFFLVAAAGSGLLLYLELKRLGFVRWWMEQ